MLGRLAGGLGASVCVMAVAIAAPAHAQVMAYDIQAGSLKSALDAYARQSGRQVIYRVDDVRGVRSPGVRGPMAADAALSAVLAGTGFSSRADATGAIAVARSGETQAGGAAADSGSADAERGTAEILVVGSRSSNVDIRRTENDAQPYVVLGREEIQRSGAASVEEFLKTRLPMNTQRDSNAQFNANPEGATSSRFNLRGLGEAQTLILVDGRRPASGVSIGGTLVQPDINGIPVSAIERIEILPSTASGIYGGGATGGVINVITRRDYQGLEASVRYGGSFRGDAPQLDLSTSGSFNLNEGRTRINFTASRSRSTPLFVGDRNFAQDARDLEFRNNPSALLDPFAFVMVVGSTPNIRSADGSNLVLDNGTQLNSPITFVPRGYRGAAADGGNGLVANAGRYNLEVPPGYYGRALNLLAGTRRTAVSVGARQELTPNLEFFADASWADNRSRTAGSTPTISTTGFPTVDLPADAPNNPFNTAVTISFALPQVRTFADIDNSNLSLTAGVIYRPWSNWSIALDHVWSRSRYSAAQTNGVFNSGFAPALTSGTFDVLRDLNLGEQDLAPYLLPTPTLRTQGVAITQNESTARLSGALLRLPADWLRINAALQYRDVRSHPAFTFVTDESGATSTRYFPERSQVVRSAYLEANIPLVSRNMDVPFVRLLELTAAVRYESNRARVTPSIEIPSQSLPLPSPDYSRSAFERPSYTLALRYKPIDDIQFRASLGTGFVPPALEQLNSPTLFGPFTQFDIVDPQRGGQPMSFPASVLLGGNPGLRPETSRSLSAGVILSPRLVPNLRLSIDYTEIRKRNEIAELNGLQELLPVEADFPGRIVRAPLTPADAALGYTAGQITLVDLSTANFARSRVRAFDIRLDYSIDAGSVGSFRLGALATYQPLLRRQISLSFPSVNQTGFSEFGARLKGNATLEWSSGPFVIGWNVQFIDSYSICGALLNVIVPSYCTQQALSQGSDRVRQQFYHDLYFNVTIPSMNRIARGMTLTASIQNIFDRDPPLLASGGDVRAVYERSGDPRLRRFNLGATLRF